MMLQENGLRSFNPSFDRYKELLDELVKQIRMEQKIYTANAEYTLEVTVKMLKIGSKDAIKYTVATEDRVGGSVLPKNTGDVLTASPWAARVLGA